MIQMVGPSDNDYIYINFKDFEYDKKWEFPRENLELGMAHTVHDFRPEECLFWVIKRAGTVCLTLHANFHQQDRPRCKPQQHLNITQQILKTYRLNW